LGLIAYALLPKILAQRLCRKVLRLALLRAVEEGNQFWLGVNAKSNPNFWLTPRSSSAPREH
jgi:hypothetical protein